MDPLGTCVIRVIRVLLSAWSLWICRTSPYLLKLDGEGMWRSHSGRHSGSHSGSMVHGKQECSPTFLHAWPCQVRNVIQRWLRSYARFSNGMQWDLVDLVWSGLIWFHQGDGCQNCVATSDLAPPIVSVPSKWSTLRRLPALLCTCGSCGTTTIYYLSSPVYAMAAMAMPSIPTCSVIRT